MSAPGRDRPPRRPVRPHAHQTRRQDLAAWIADVDTSDLPHLKTFVNGIRHDHDAVLNGLRLHHSSGAVEGAVNRL